jgi:hypothetical protein
MLIHLLVLTAAALADWQTPPSVLPHGTSLGQSGERVSRHAEANSDSKKAISQPGVLIEESHASDSNQKPSYNAQEGQHAAPDGWGLADKIALGACIFAGLQFVALILTIAIMIRTGRRQLRAYVIPETGAIINVANPDPAPGPARDTDAAMKYPEWGPAVRIQIKNVGQTPAYDVLHWASLDFREYPLKSTLPLMPQEESMKHRSPLGPGIPITKSLSYRKLTGEEISSLKQGSGCLYWNGVILYRDIFRKKHTTWYRLMYGSMGGAVGVNTDLTFAEEGNETEDTVRRWNFRRPPRPARPKHETNAKQGT